MRIRSLAQKLEKKFFENVDKKKIVDGIDEKYVDQSKPANGYESDISVLQRNINKKFVWSSSPQQMFFL